MKTVRIRKFKGRLSKYVRLAQAGERVTVTHRGKPVVDLVPHSEHRLDSDDALLRLARAGVVRLGTRGPAVYTRPPQEDQVPDGVVAEVLDEVRGDR